MGLTAKFKSDEVSRKLAQRGKRTTLALRNRLGEAAQEFHQVMIMLVPHKSGTLSRAIKIKKITKNHWSVWVNADAKVRSRIGKTGNKPIYVRDYLATIESGNFEAIGPKSRLKEELTNKRKLAGLKVQRSPQGSYVGGIFFGRTLDALEIKWQKRFDKVFKSAMERGLI